MFCESQDFLNSLRKNYMNKTPDKVVITRNEMEVHCYGEWKEDSNALVLFCDAHGNDYEEIFADGARDWEDAVEKVTTWASKNGFDVDEMQEC